MQTPPINFLFYFLTFAALSEEGRTSFITELQDEFERRGQSSIHRQRVQALKEIQRQQDELKARYLEEKRAFESALEKKYQELNEPLNAKRYEIVNGGTIVEAEGSSTNVDRGVPDFWLLALKNHEVIGDEITTRDEGALKYLKDIKWCKSEEPKGFKFEFHFDTNPYFKNSILTKIYHMVGDEEPMLRKATGTEIEWYPGKSLIQQQQLPSYRLKGANQISKIEECGSFFGFFDPTQPLEDKIVSYEVNKVIYFQMREDYEIGAILRKKIIPHAVSWYTGEAIDSDDEDSDDDDSSGTDDEDENKDDDNNEAAT